MNNQPRRYPHARAGVVTESPTATLRAKFKDAIGRNQLEAAERISARNHLDENSDPEILPHLAILRLKQQRFDDAEILFARLAESQPSAAFQRNLARNLAAVQRHRPELLKLLFEPNPCTTCQVIKLPNGQLSIVQTPVGYHQPRLLTPEGDPAAACRQYVELLADFIAEGKCFALCGIGDGYFLRYLAAHPPEFFQDRTQCIHFCEIHPEVIIHAFMIHDYAGADGPIQQQRFAWWVGPDWCQQLAQGFRNDPFLPYPEQFVKLSLVHSQMEKQLNQMADSLIEWEEQMLAEIQTHYAQRKTAEWVELLGPNPPRPPRALLITSRFSTVIQYSTRDIEEALQQEGWETHLVIESEQHQIIANRALLQALREFQPDVFIQIDHLRQECPNLYPPALPFICWIQDNLPNLTRKQAGTQLHQRDFILTCDQATYTNKYHYPARQCIYVDKLTRPVTRPAGPNGTGPPDLVFVSNAAQIPAELVPEILTGVPDSSEIQALLGSVCREMIETYARGETIFTLHEIRALINRETTRCGGRWRSSEIRDQLAIRLSGHLNNALYRQQTLDWIVEIAERLNLSLELYGKGWEDNPKYARFAKGWIQYGPPLEELTRRAKINFQIVPYSCLHQRLLDGLTAGGFFLIREYPLDTHATELAEFMTEHITPGMHSIEDAERLLPTEIWDRLARLNERNRELAEHAGADLVQTWQRFVKDELTFMIQGLPRRPAVSFSDPQTLEKQIQSYLENENQRAEIQTLQREFIENNLTYQGGFRRIMRTISQLISTEEADGLTPQTKITTRAVVADGSSA